MAISTPNKTNTTILDLILEKASNIENESNSTKTIRLLNEAILLNSKKEREVRTNTITIELTNIASRDAIEDLVDEYLEQAKEAASTVWQDKKNCYIQFPSTPAKNLFIRHLDELAQTDPIAKELKNKLRPAIITGQHFQRKPVRLEVFTKRNQVEATRLQEILTKMCEDAGGLQEFKEGKRGPQTVGKHFFFRVQAEAFEKLLHERDGIIPYSAKDGRKTFKTHLHIKINAKPYTCRDCFKVGQHKCAGKACNQCSKPGHNAKDCQQITTHCDNCNTKGHRAKDLHCPYFLNETAKELRKMDIPLKFLEKKDARFFMIKQLQLR